MARVASACFGLIAYAIFLCSFLYAIGFVFEAIVPKTIDTGPVVPTIQAVILLFSLVYVLINLAVDLAYTLFDPRIRY